MKIVIDIPDKDYKDIVDGYICQELADEMLNRVKDGTPLPKGHGDLVERKCKNKICRDCAYAYVCYRLDASVIIPADKGGRK